MLALLKKILFAVTVILLVVIGYQNAEILSAKTYFVFGADFVGFSWRSPEFPVVLLYGVFFLLGLLFAGFHGIYERIARKAEARKRNKRIKALEAEIEGLRSQLAELNPPPAAAESPAAETDAPRIEAPARDADEQAPTL